MQYKCNSCQTTKSLVNLTPTELVYCFVCDRLTRYLPVSSDSSTAPERTRSGSSPFDASRTLAESLARTHLDIVLTRDLWDQWELPVLELGRSRSMASTTRPCDYFNLCLEYLLSLKYSSRLFNDKHNRCYCEQCYRPSERDFLVQGDAKYVIPRGWVRFGLHVDDAQAEAEDIWNTWIVSYHGTNPVAAKSIIEHHLFLLPGDACITGSVIRICEGHIEDQNKVFTSPSIAYSGDDIYSPTNRFRSASGKTHRAKIVLQCRQQPRTYKTQGETINAGIRRICPIIPNSELEYFTEVRSSIIPYGLLIRLF